MRAAGILWSQAMDTKMSRSEKIVAGLAVAVLVAGFATGVFAKPLNPGPHGSVLITHMAPAKASPSN
jgi:hypothetical protein